MPKKLFTKDYQPDVKKKGRKHGPTATDWLRTLSHTNIKFNNPMTGKLETGPVNLVVAIQLILKATQDSDLPSIKEYLDRMDGKVTDKTEISGSVNGEMKVVFITPKERAVEHSPKALSI